MIQFLSFVFFWFVMMALIFGALVLVKKFNKK